MNTEHDDYLWDGTGKVDSQIQELENILGSLRHKGTAPKLPARPKSVFSLTPMLAIAASILIVLGVGAWIGLRSHVSQEPTSKQTAVNAVPAPQPRVENNQNTAVTQPTAPDVDNGIKMVAQPGRVKRASAASALHGMTAEEIKEGREAKKQLMLAMRITSVKLNQARKKVQEDSHVVKS